MTNTVKIDKDLVKSLAVKNRYVWASEAEGAASFSVAGKFLALVFDGSASAIDAADRKLTFAKDDSVAAGSMKRYSNGIWYSKAEADATFAAHDLAVSGVSVSTVYGGAFLSRKENSNSVNTRVGKTATVTGPVGIELDNAKVSFVYGGGAGVGSVLDGDVSISIRDSRVSKVYGGGYKADVNGNVTVGLAGNVKKVGNVYAGGFKGNVTGEAVVQFADSAALTSYTRTVSGTGYGRSAAIAGDSTLLLENVSGDFKGTVKGFDNLVIAGSSTVTFKKSQNASMRAADYQFVLNDTTAATQFEAAMLTWNKAFQLNSVTVKVEMTGDNALSQDLVLVSSTKFTKATSFSVDNVTILNADGKQMYSGLYRVNYTAYDKKAKTGGTVSLHYDDAALTISANTTLAEGDEFTTTARDEAVTIQEGISFTGDMDLAGGNDTLTLEEEASLVGNVSLGDGNDTVTLAQDAKIDGTIDLGAGDDALVLTGRSATLDLSKVDMGEGSNTLRVGQSGAAEGTTVTLVKEAEEAESSGDAVQDSSVAVAQALWDAGITTIDIAKGCRLEFGTSLTEAELTSAYRDIATAAGSTRTLTITGEGKDASFAKKFSAMYQINAKSRASLNGTSNNDWLEFNNGNGSTAVSGKLKTFAGDDVISFRVDKDGDAAMTYTLNLVKNGADALDLGDGTNVISTYTYNLDSEVTATSIKKVTGDHVPSADANGAYQASSTTVNTVQLLSKTFANSIALKTYFDERNVDALLGQFNITTDTNRSLTVVEGIGSGGAFNFDKLDELRSTDFATEGDALTLTQGEVLDVVGYTTVNFSGETAGGTVTGGKVLAAKIVEADGLAAEEINLATVDTLASVEGFTGTVTNGATTGASTIAATDATATFNGYDTITAMTAGMVEGTFTKVEDDEVAAGSLTKVEFADSMLNYTGSDADDALTLAGTAYGAIDLGAGDDTLTLGATLTSAADVANVELVNFGTGATGANVTWKDTSAAGDGKITFADFEVDAASHTFKIGAIDSSYENGDVSFTCDGATYTWDAGKSAWVSSASAAVITYDGTDTITYGIPITITLNDYSNVYDGTKQTIAAADVSASTANYTIEGLLSGDTISFSTTVSSTNVTSVTNNNVDLGTVTIMRSGVDVTGEYVLNAGADAQFEITKRAITLTTTEVSNTYNGYAQSSRKFSVTAGSYASGDDLKYSDMSTTSIDQKSAGTGYMNAGTYTNAITTYKIKNAAGKNVSSNYDVTLEAGSFEITKKAITFNISNQSAVVIGSTGGSDLTDATAYGLCRDDALGSVHVQFEEPVGLGTQTHDYSITDFVLSAGTKDNYVIAESGHVQGWLTPTTV